MQLKEIILLLSVMHIIVNKVECESVRLLDSMPEIDIGEYAIVNNGANVTISCDKLDENADDFAWQFKGVDLQFTGFVAQDPYSRIHQYSSGEITVLKIDEEYVGDYRCTAVTQGSLGVTDTSTLEVSLGCPSGCEGDVGENGYIGRRGPEGAPGAQGVSGICYPEQCPRPGIGEKGDPGPDGVKGEIGADGEKGEMGNKGEPGEDGVNGMKGERGSIGDDGSKGIAGDIGGKGEKGNQIKSEKGVKGTIGDTGDRGAEGDKGQKGVAGTGPDGDFGDQGEQGLLGSKGVKGDDGEGGDKGTDGQKGEIGQTGAKGMIGASGSKGNKGKIIMISEIDSINNPDCSSAEYEQGQIIYDTVIDQFIYCDGNQFQCIRDKPCFDEECEADLQYVELLESRKKSLCVNLVWVFDESASMRPEHEWLREISELDIPLAVSKLDDILTQNNTLNCNNSFAIATFGGNRLPPCKKYGNIIPLGPRPGLPPNWGTTEDVQKVIGGRNFDGTGAEEDAYAAAYRAIRLLEFQALSCKKIVIFTDEDRDTDLLPCVGETERDSIPYLEFNIMKDILKRHNIVLSGVVEFDILVDGIQTENAIGLLPDGSAVTCEGDSNNPSVVIKPNGMIQPDSGDGNTVEAYVELIKASGGIAWSLPRSRQSSLRRCFTLAFIKLEVAEATTGCFTTTCQNCTCPDGSVDCKTINPISYEDVAERCAPPSCDENEYIRAFRRPSCVDMVFVADESSSKVEDFMKTVSIQLQPILRSINFGQQDSSCQNMYGLLLYGSNDQDRNIGVPYKFGDELFETALVAGPAILNLTFAKQGNVEDGYAAIYITLDEYLLHLRKESSHQITLITDRGRDTIMSDTIPNLTPQVLRDELAVKKICLNVIVNARFRTNDTREEAMGLVNFQGIIYAALVDGTSYRLVKGGEVIPQTPEGNTEEAYIELALDGVCGSAWNLQSSIDNVVSFVKAFVIESVVKWSELFGQTELCVFCECMNRVRQPCITVDPSSSPVCQVGEPPSLSYTSGTYNVIENTEYRIGAVSERNEGSNAAVYVLASNQTDFTLYSQLRTGTTPINVKWYYSMAKGDSQRVNLGSYANPNGDTSLTRYELQRNIWQEGYYYVNVSNAYGYDYQYARIVFRPRWSHGWESGAGSFIIDRSVGFFGENLRINAGSELRLTEYVVQGTRDWTITYFLNGELVAAQYGPSNTTIYNSDFMIEFSGDRYTLVLSSYQSTYSGTYTAYVRNAYGNDSVTSTIETELLVTCNPDPNTSNNCACSRENDKLVYTLFGHSFPEGTTLEWVVRDGSNNKIEAISQIVTISGKMSFMLAANEYCNNGPATVSAQIESQAEIRFTCNCDVDCPDAACCKRRDILIKSTCGENFADIFVLVDVSSSMEPEHEFLVQFIPRLEYDLRQNCIGESDNFTNQNQYKFVAFGGVGERTLPYFVGPDYDLIRDCSASPFAVDVICNSSGCFSESIRQLRENLPADGDTEDGYAATKFALSNCARRENALTIVFLVTDEPKGYPFNTFNALTSQSFYEIADQGKSLYTQFLLNNNVIQVSILNTNLVAKDENDDSVQCIGINSEFKCSYANAITNEIQETRIDVRADLQGSLQRQMIADDYIIPTLNASGFIFDLNLLRLGSVASTNAVSEALRKEVGFRALLDLSECKSCLCLLGENVQCSPLVAGKVADNCKCLQTIRNETVFQNDTTRQENFCNCLIEEERSTKYCRCRFEDGLGVDQCTIQEEFVVIR